MNVLSLSYPSLDSMVLANGLGPGGDEIPEPNAAFGLEFSDGSKADFPSPYLINNPSNTLTIETADPPPGVTNYIYSDPGATANDVVFAIGFSCLGQRRGYFSMIEEGDLITVSTVGKADGTGGTPKLRYFIQWYGETGTDLGGGYQSGDIDLTTSYVTYQRQAFVPSGLSAPVKVARFRVDQHFASADDAIFFGDIQIILTPGLLNLLLCSFASLITIDNSTTETSFV